MSSKLSQSSGKKAEKKTSKKHEELPVIYPQPKADLAMGPQAITSSRAKELLGWQDVAEGSGYVREVQSLLNARALLTHNVTNRPIYPQVVRTLAQEVLRQKWQFNGEPIIVGQKGSILNGQHSLLSLLLAVDLWAKDKDHWTAWKTEPTMDKLIVFGVSEDDAVVNTMDTCKPRTLADVIYRSDFFSSMKPGERSICARMTDHAIRMTWHRTGAGMDAFAPRRTHAESLDFLARHEKILAAVKHIKEEDGGKGEDQGKIAKYVSPGYAAGLLYLMGCSATDPTVYVGADAPNESMLDWSRWDQACDFWVKLAGNSEETKEVGKAISAILQRDGSISQAERWGIISLAWCCYADGGKITPKELELEYLTDDEGGRKLAEHPSVGGIDLGDPNQGSEARDPEPDKIEVRKKEAKKITAKRQGPKEAKRAGDDWAEGDVAWVTDQDGDHYLGKLLEDPYDCDDGSQRVRVQADDGEWEVMVDDLHLRRPGTKPSPIKAVAPKPSSPLAKKPEQSAKGKPPKKTKDAAWKPGMLAWVADKDPWQGRIMEISGSVCRLKVQQGFAGTGSTRAVKVVDLQPKQPGIPV